jgi:cell division protein FtsA
MAKVYPERIFTSIDVGTTKICVLIAQYNAQNQLDIIGIGKAPSDGLRKGVVVDIGRTIASIRLAVTQAQEMAGVIIQSAAVGISGGHISSSNSHGVTPIKNGEITHTDIANALASARAIPVAEGQQILHVLPQYFVIDGQERVHNPLGMHGIRLEVRAHIILGAIASVQNLISCCQQANITVDDIILEQLASAQAVLSPDERRLGVAVLDIGGGTSDLAIYQDDAIRHTRVIPIAGNHFTNDIAIGLRATIGEAERIKKEYGIALEDVLGEDQLIEFEMAQTQVKRLLCASELIDIIKPRAQELLCLVHEEIIAHHMRSYVTTGLVLTGGGSLLRGVSELAQTILNMPVRVGNPRITAGLPELLNNPIYATAYGMVLYTADKKAVNANNPLNGPLVERVFERMKSWVLDFF